MLPLSALQEPRSVVPNIAHDLLSPLCTISSISSYIVEEYGDRLGESGMEYLRLLQESATRMHAVIERVFPDSIDPRLQRAATTACCRRSDRAVGAALGA